MLIGLWVSVRNSEKQGINPEHAWNLGILVVLCGIVGAKILYIVNDWGYYTAHPGRDFQFCHLAGRRSFFRRADWRRNRSRLVYPQTSHAPTGHMGRFRARPGPGSRYRARGLFRGRLLLWQADNALLGSDVQESFGADTGWVHRWEFRWSRRNFSNRPSKLANFFILMWLFKHKKFDGQVLGAYLFLYGVARFFLEFLRDDPGRGSVFGGLMTGTQLIAIGLVITGGFIWWLRPGMKAVPAHATR